MKTYIYFKEKNKLASQEIKKDNSIFYVVYYCSVFAVI